ncbi:branched-chain amino acid ABC transporter permease [Catenulispora sp. NF23]|uniref:branched-chain amino acid ABC transporter permease n=1 Tax=Catenulispora pinistramenti TaxID=2705254 RepID=UPI001BA5AC15|nr:branched-chain amino acid ABC transporter permease [Catenulispora pinistramenti]MBS2536348.1 branched-chain amino acid ABC transporter permease [Catenulispora pinistramenti]
MKRHVKNLIPVAVLAVLLSLPYSTLRIPGVFDGAVNTPGSLQLLALCLLFAGLAIGYDLLFGRLGLMSFGHALYVALGAYSAESAMKNLHLPLALAALLATAIGAAVSTLLGAVSLKGVGKLGTENLGTVGFAMVTLAFAQAGSILVGRDPKTTGGEEGLPLSTEKVPAAFVGVVNTVNLYWLALAYLVLVCAVVWWLTDSRVGRAWQAIRDNERRAEVLGLNPFRYQLGAFVLAGTLGAVGGVVHLLVTAGATPETTTTDFTLALLVMVVLGGSGTRWGPVLGGVLYTLLDHRLGAVATSDSVAGLPAVLRVPLSQPLVLLGVLFVLVVYAVPGGLAALPSRLRGRRPPTRPGLGGRGPRGQRGEQHRLGVVEGEAHGAHPDRVASEL